MTTFTPLELEYLASQRLGRLATVDAEHAPQNNPVAFVVGDDGTVDIGGFAMGNTRKFHNVEGNERVALVVDDIVAFDPWQVRGVEIRGRADTLTDVEPAQPWLSRELIRIHPERIISWGLEAPAGGPERPDEAA